ncbi:LAFE_0H17216g1_1 [Lachancea fermentati]|uniref:LAFE_0H17216g1_1 n=1 Tax=Lachancea fermentati TaxID=4955 RepID=A0A1G4ML63_LACFM|nr:LAFE_0H17216g1_1 [Lachancea fermentati]
MLRAVKEYVGGWFNDGDTRKKEDGSLNEWKRRANGHRSRRYRVQKPGSMKPTTTTRATAVSRKRQSPSIWEKVKGVFSTEDQELLGMKRAYSDFQLSTHPSPMQTRSQIQRRIAKSAVLRRKLSEKQYDDKQLEELRRGRKLVRSPKRIGEPRTFETDQLLLLQHKLETMTHRLSIVEKDLKITKKRLKFSQEKNALLESLLDDANIDNEYVRSRRQIRNIQKENLKPIEGEIPPSPQHAMSPLFTSSPMRFNNQSDVRLDEQDKFYHKYPKIPEAELLPNNPDDSLSPIRVDYSKYSSSRGL